MGVRDAHWGHQDQITQDSKCQAARGHCGLGLGRKQSRATASES